jgi:hypothetical protein
MRFTLGLGQRGQEHPGENRDDITPAIKSSDIFQTAAA